MDTNYNIMAIDAQYYLFRNLCALKSRTAFDTVDVLDPREGDASVGYVITKYDFTAQDLIKQFIYTIVSFIRDQYSCKKFILLWDTPAYHKLRYVPDFKDGRHHYCQQTLDEWDIKSDPEGYLQEKEDYRIDQIKSEAKWWIINNLKDFGMPSAWANGFEADDLAYIFSHNPDINSGSSKSAIVSADSDWLYWCSSNVDWIQYNPRKKCDIWTYKDGMSDGEGKYEKLNLSLFEAKMWMDSTFYSHNDLKPTTSCGWNDFEDLVNTARSGDYSMYSDPDRLHRNLNSFKIWDYPNIMEAMDRIISAVNKSALNSELYEVLKSRGLNISPSYAQGFVNMMDPITYPTISISDSDENLIAEWLNCIRRPDQVQNLISGN